MKLSILNHNYTIIRFDPSSAIPGWVKPRQGELLSITYTSDELSIVCVEELLPASCPEPVERDWKAIKVEGPLDFSLTGILYRLAKPLAEQKISIFAVSTFDTDYLLVKADQLAEATEALTREGHIIVQS
ncbi:ACT domain-containing protein [Paenibacillus sambharensis]|uniref:ACT domain-containing protein n=1 Tax=Paenibacillus sambharensis TaxID=1803190 RepID=A0A2W1LAD7_9BACL|nr:ACT domain-containing protein [Paenibacillus sambharensis]PZD96186.1 ACT domain-containing protein [Paenibacillus sambharensis]